MPPSSTRQLGHACRIYKNSAGKVIAIDEINVNVNKEQINLAKFIVSLDKVDIDRTILHLTVGGSRIVSSIQMLGDYSSIQENSGNFFIVRWDAASADENYVEFSLESYVAKVGDTI